MSFKQQLYLQIVPAQTGFYPVIDFYDLKQEKIGEPIITWRIETHSKEHGDSVFSECFPSL